MADVIATQRGYFGGVIREAGDKFIVPDDLWNDKDKRPSWAKAAKFGGKGDHDDDGKAGGSKPADAPEDAKPSGRAKGKVKGETVEAPTAEPFADAPEPTEAKPKGNGVKEALGGPAPDWVAPKPID